MESTGFRPSLLQHLDTTQNQLKTRTESTELRYRCFRDLDLGVPLTTVLSVVALVPAQDVVKVSETHKVLLENEHVRVLDFHVKPGEKVGIHSHPSSVVYYLTDAKVKYTYPDGRTQERTVKAGTALWIEAVTHDVENVGANEFHGLHIELKEPTK